MMSAQKFYEIVLKDCLLSFVVTTSKQDNFHELFSEFLDNLEDLWILDLIDMGVRIEKKDKFLEAFKAFYDANWKNQSAVELLKDIEKVDIEEEREDRVTLSIKQCPYREFHEELKVLDVPVDFCLLGAFIVRGTQRFMKEKKEIDYTYSFHPSECTLVLKNRSRTI